MRLAPIQDARAMLSGGFWPRWAVLVFVGWSLLMAPAQNGQKLSGMVQFEVKEKSVESQAIKSESDMPAIRIDQD